jgi:hypothetical protein
MEVIEALAWRWGLLAWHETCFLFASYKYKRRGVNNTP